MEFSTESPKVHYPIFCDNGTTLNIQNHAFLYIKVKIKLHIIIRKPIHRWLGSQSIIILVIYLQVY